MARHTLLLGLWLAAASLSGCAALFGSYDDGAGDDASAGALDDDDGRLGGAPESLRIYFERMAQLTVDDPDAQAEAFAEIEADAERDPTTTHRLLMALALAVPGHAASDAAAAGRRLGELLAEPDGLLPGEQALAIVQLNEIQQRLALADTTAQTRSEAAAQLAQLRSASAARLDAALEENNRLRAELESATKMLDQLTTIEETIRERDNGTNTP